MPRRLDGTCTTSTSIRMHLENSSGVCFECCRRITHNLRLRTTNKLREARVYTINDYRHGAWPLCTSLKSIINYLLALRLRHLIKYNIEFNAIQIGFEKSQASLVLHEKSKSTLLHWTNIMVVDINWSISVQRQNYEARVKIDLLFKLNWHHVSSCKCWVLAPIKQDRPWGRKNIHGIHLKIHFDEWQIMMVADVFGDDEKLYHFNRDASGIREWLAENLFSANGDWDRMAFEFYSTEKRELIKNLASLSSLALDVNWLSFSVSSVCLVEYSSRSVQLN